MTTKTQNPSLRRLNATMLLAGLIASALILSAGFALADTEISKSGEAASNGVVTIENLAGSVKIKGWNKDEIEVTGTLDKKAKELKFKTGKKSIIEVVYPRRVKNINEGSHLVIMVPRGSSLDVECVSASIEISGVNGEIDVQAISGDIDVTGPCESLEAEAISGNVTLENAGSMISVECISGEVRATGSEANIEVEGVDSSIELEFDRFLNLSVESVSGTIDVTGALDDDGSFSMSVHSGDVTLTVPGNVSADFEASTFSGDIETEFGYEGERTSKYLPGQELEFSVGGGDADVEITTFSGNIMIKKM